MASITLKGNPIHTIGDLPETGGPAPDFLLTKSDLTDISLETFAGKRLVMNIFPSLDTAVCATSVRKFNAEAEKLPDTVVLCISKDLPFAHSRFCAAEGLNNVVSASVLRDEDFGVDYGVLITDGPLAGLLSRAVLVVDETGTVIYAQQVPDIVEEPDYAAALSVLQ